MKIKTLLQIICLSIIVGIFILWGIAFLKSHSAYQEGENFLRLKEYPKAILALEQSLLNDFPWSPYREKSSAKLLFIGDLAIRQKDLPVALQAYHALLFARASLEVYRHLPQEPSEKAGERLRAIFPEGMAGHLPDYRPQKTWALVMGISLLAWIFSVFAIIQAGFDQEGDFKMPKGFWLLGIFVAAFLIWVVSITRL